MNIVKISGPAGAGKTEALFALMRDFSARKNCRCFAPAYGDGTKKIIGRIRDEWSANLGDGHTACVFIDSPSPELVAKLETLGEFPNVFVYLAVDA